MRILRYQALLAATLSCFFSANSFAQLIYISDTRNILGSAAVDNLSQYSSAPFYTTSYTGDYSGSAAPSTPYADFQGSVNGSAVFQGGINFPSGQQPATISSTVGVSQNSFLHSQEISYSSVESVSGSSSYAVQNWSGQGSSLMQVSFQVLTPLSYTLMVAGTGDPASTSDNYSLTSSGEGTLVNGSTFTMLNVNHNYGGSIDYSGIFNPGNTYTLTFSSEGNADGGGLHADLVVPEPSLAALAGMALVIFLRRMRTTK